MQTENDWLQGKTALVTGAARRLGRATALALARAGADLVLHYRSSRGEAEGLAAEVTAMGVRAWTLRADFAEPNAAATLAAGARETAGTVHLLVNNASIYPADRLDEFSCAALTRVLQVNAFAPLVLMRAIARQGAEACIVNLLDCRMVGRDPEHASYHISKRMLLGLTRTCALEFAPRVRVNAVAPGLVLAPEDADPGYLRRLAGSNPLATHGSAPAVAEAVLFLARARFVTGQIVYVDGGRNLLEQVY